ncbi:MAG: metallopeptidase TldD-related protein [Planctomycetota bacterium]
MKSLRLGDDPSPYFVSYRLNAVRGVSIWGRYGAVFSSDEFQENDLYAEVRVGTYDFDQTLDGGLEVDLYDRESHDWLGAPQDLDPEVLRYSLWKLTQRKYEEALRDYYDKRKVLVDQHLQHEGPSFSREPRIRHVEEVRTTRFPVKRWEELVRAASAAFRGHRDVQDPYVRLRAVDKVRVYASSEGSRFLTQDRFYELSIKGWRLAADGSWLSSFEHFHVRAPDDLPRLDALRAAGDRIAADLAAQQEARPLEPYAGPALLSGLASGLIFHEALGHRLEGERMISRAEGRTFAGRIGAKILPDSVSITDDPTLERWDGAPMYGHYRVDDEGVRARPVQLVDRGRLVAFLTSRAPVPGHDASNGHGRAERYQDPMARMANLVITSDEALSREALEERLLTEVRDRGLPYGIVIEGALGGETRTDHYDFQAFKGHPTRVFTVDPETGRRTRVRNVDFIGTPLAVIQRILAFGEDYEVDNSYCVAESGSVPVATVAPAMLVGDLELQKSSVRAYRPMILPLPPMPPRRPGRRRR